MQNEFVSLISNQAKKYGNREALRYRDYLTDQWTSMSWKSFKQDIERCAHALLQAGVEPQGKVAVFSQNCGTWQKSGMQAWKWIFARKAKHGDMTILWPMPLSTA